MEGFGIFLGRCLEEDGVEVFQRLNVKFQVFSVLKYFKRDLGIHIDLDFSFPFNYLECVYSIMDL